MMWSIWKSVKTSNHFLQWRCQALVPGVWPPLMPLSHPTGQDTQTPHTARGARNFAMLRAKWQEATACVHIILYFFYCYCFSSTLLQNKSMDTCLFFCLFPFQSYIWSPHPQIIGFEVGGPQRMHFTFCPPSPHLFFCTVVRCMFIVSVIPGHVMNLTWRFSRTTPNLGVGDHRWL